MPVFSKGNVCGELRDASLAVSKNLVVTVGEDHHVRLWEFSVQGSVSSSGAGGGTSGGGPGFTMDQNETRYHQISA